MLKKIRIASVKTEQSPIHKPESHEIGRDNFENNSITIQLNLAYKVRYMIDS